MQKLLYLIALFLLLLIFINPPLVKADCDAQYCTNHNFSTCSTQCTTSSICVGTGTCSNNGSSCTPTKSCYGPNNVACSCINKPANVSIVRCEGGDKYCTEPLAGTADCKTCSGIIHECEPPQTDSIGCTAPAGCTATRTCQADYTWGQCSTPSCPACTFSYINVNGGGSYAEVPSGGNISINWGVTGADNTKSCTWVGDNPGSNPSPQSGSVQFSITNTTPNPIDKNYQLSCYNPSNQSCTSGQVSVRIPGPTPTPIPSTPPAGGNCTWSACSPFNCGSKTCSCADGSCTSLTTYLGCSCSTAPGLCTLNVSSVGINNISVSMTTIPPAGFPNNYDHYSWSICGGGSCRYGDNLSAQTSFSSLLSNTQYTITGQAYTLPFSTPATNTCEVRPTTGTASTNPTGNLYCMNCVSGTSAQSRWRSEPNCNGMGCAGCQGNDGNINFGKEGSQCHGDTDTHITEGGADVGGYIWVMGDNGVVDAYNPDYQPRQDIIQHLDLQLVDRITFPSVSYWINNLRGILLCPINNGQNCVTYYIGHNYYQSGADGPGGYGLGNSVMLTGWDPRYEPVGYILFQGGDINGCSESPETDLNPKTTKVNRTTLTSVYRGRFYWWGGWNGDGSIGTPGNSPGSGNNLSWPFRNNSYPNPGAPFCTPHDAPLNEADMNAIGAPAAKARVDWVFKKATKKISGQVFVNVNGDLVHDANETTGIANVPLNLSNSSTNFPPAATDSSGNFSFDDLLPGTYTLSVSTPSGYKRTYPAADSVTITLTNADRIQDFGLTPVFSISGTVRNDVGHDGSCVGDPYFTNARMSLSGGPTAKLTIDVNGAGGYAFQDLDAGTYTVTVIPAGTNLDPTPPQTVTVGPSKVVDFCINYYNILNPWFQTSGGDVFSNEEIIGF